MSKTHTRRRLNLRAVLALAAVGLLSILGFYVLGGYQEDRVLRSGLTQARRFRGDKQPGLALRHVDQYLELRPDDPVALEMRAELLSELARTSGDLSAAIKAYERLLKQDPDGPGSRKAKRRLCELYILMSDGLKASQNAKLLPEETLRSLRYQAAEVIAGELVNDTKTEEVEKAPLYRLLAMAQEGQAGAGNDRAKNEAIANYEKALDLDPGDVLSAERLARIFKDRRKDPARAEGVLDKLLAARPESVPVRLVRHRFLVEVGRDDRARAELESALKLAPEDPGVLLVSAEDALRHGDTKLARARIDAIPPAMQDDLRVLTIRGLIDFGDEHPNEAIDDWRRGLILVGGTSAELTWRLAYVLLHMGRGDEARPLVEQYRRLDQENSPSLQLLLAMQDEQSGRFTQAIGRLERARDRLADRWQGTLNLILGRCYEGIKDEEKALDAYREAIRIDPKASSPRLAVARIMARRGGDVAIAELEKGLATIPGDPALAVALAELRLQQQLMLPPARRSWAAFDAALGRAAAVAPRNPAVALMRADRALIDRGKEGALRVLEEAARQDPRGVMITMALAEGLTRAGRPEQALQVLERASGPEGAGDQASFRVARARLLTALGRGREARALLVRDVDRLPQPDRVQVWMALGQLCASQGDQAEARKAYEQAAGLQPDDVRPRIALLEMNLAAGDEAASRSTIEKLHEIGGKDDHLWRLAEANYQLWKASVPGTSTTARDAALNAAGQRIDEVLKAVPSLPEVHRLHGQVLEQRGKIDEAIDAYRMARDRGSEAALSRLVDLLARQHRYDDLAHLRKSNATPRLDRLEAQAFLRLGDKDQASRLVNEVARDQPDSQAWQAEMLDRLGRFEDAEAVLQKMVEEQPGALEPWLVLLRYQAAHKRSQAIPTTLRRIKAEVKTDRPELLEARCRWAANDRAGAEKAFEEALGRSPEGREVQLSASQFYEGTGRMDRAEACLRQILARDPNDRPVSRRLAILLSARAVNAKAWEAAWATLGPEAPEIDQPEDRLARAMILSRAPDPARRDDAVKRLESLVADLSADLAVTAQAREFLAKLLLDTGHPDRASQIAAVSTESGSSPAAIALYAEALLRSKRFDAAAVQLDRLASIAPGDAREANIRARLVRERSQPTEAASALEKAYLERENTPGAEDLGREIFRQLLVMGPQAVEVAERLAHRIAARSPSASWMPAMLALRRGQYDQAITLCRTAAQAGDPGLAIETGRIAFEAAVGSRIDPENVRGALEVLGLTIKLVPGSEELLTEKAMLLHLEGRFDDEVRIYREVLSRQPENPVILNNLAWSLSEGLNHPSEAMTYVEQYLKRPGRLAEVLDTRGRILIRLGRTDDAIKDLEEVVRVEPTGAHLFHLAYAYHKAGRDEDYRKTIERVRKSGLTIAGVDSTERAEFEALVGP